MIEYETKKEDIKLRRQHLELQQSALRAYAKTGDESEWKLAKFFGERSRELAERIRTRDYTQDEIKRIEFNNRHHLWT